MKNIFICTDGTWNTTLQTDRGTHKFVMLPNEMISVDFNVYLSSNAAGTQYAVVGRLA
jgi:hypothetical protein